MLFSGILPVTGVSAQVASCGIGQEVTVFGLVFCNSQTSVRNIVLSLYRQATGTATTLQLEVGAKAKLPFDKPISLQPGDHLDVYADLTGVSLLWSVDQDAGVNPVASGFVIKGAHSNVTAYSALDIVYKDGASYVAIQNNTNKDPEVETAYWMLLLDGSGVTEAIDAIVAGAPTDLNTLNKIAAALGNDPDFADTVSNALALKADASTLSAVALSGSLSDLVGVNKLNVRRMFFSREPC